MTVAYVFGRWDAASRECAAAPNIPSDEVFRRIANGDRLAEAICTLSLIPLPMAAATPWGCRIG
jgi:hypothetical protein